MKLNNETIRTAVKDWLENSKKAEGKYGHVSDWDVSMVTSMSRLFERFYRDTLDISNWDVSNVNSMDYMFFSCPYFNADISKWDVSNVINMNSMFYNAKSFNQDIGSWDVSNVTNMNSMFGDHKSFNQNIGNWNVGNVTNMGYMFYNAQSFNQDIGKWDVSNVTEMSWMFNNSKSFNQAIGSWDVSNVTNMKSMFENTESFNQDIGNWDVSNVNTMDQMFYSSYIGSFNKDISKWNVSNVTEMSWMFKNSKSFNQDIGSWDVSNVTNMNSMFENTESFNQDIGNWDVSNVTAMSEMFKNSESFNQDLANWDVQDVYMDGIFDNAISFKQDTNKWKWMDKILDPENEEESSGSINLDIEITPTEIQKLKKGSKCTVFLTNSKEHLLVIFKATYDEEYIDEVLDHTVAKDTIDGYDTIVNLTEDESVDLKEYPPVLIKCSSQSVLNILHHYMPEKKFVLVYSWDLPEKHDVGEYDDYLDSLWDSSQQEETSEYANNDGKVEVVNKLLRVYVTDENVTENEPGLQIINFPSSSKSMQFASECGCGHNFEYDDLIVFEKEVFDNLEIKKVDGQIEWEGDSFPIAPILNLEVEKYKSKVILKH